MNLAEKWNEKLHPRGEGGRFSSSSTSLDSILPEDLAKLTPEELAAFGFPAEFTPEEIANLAMTLDKVRIGWSPTEVRVKGGGDIRSRLRYSNTNGMRGTDMARQVSNELKSMGYQRGDSYDLRAAGMGDGDMTRPKRSSESEVRVINLGGGSQKARISVKKKGAKRTLGDRAADAINYGINPFADSERPEGEPTMEEAKFIVLPPKGGKKPIPRKPSDGKVHKNEKDALISKWAKSVRGVKESADAATAELTEFNKNHGKDGRFAPSSGAGIGWVGGKKHKWDSADSSKKLWQDSVDAVTGRSEVGHALGMKRPKAVKKSDLLKSKAAWLTKKWSKSLKK